LISKDNRVRPPAGQVVPVLCGSYPRQVNGAPLRAERQIKKAAGGSGGFLVRPRVEMRVTPPAQLLWSIRQNRTVPALRSAWPTVSTLQLNYFKCC
jgi:hypothetical protein